MTQSILRNSSRGQIMKIETIKKQLQGYFINKTEFNGMDTSEKLCKKIDDSTFKTLEPVTTYYGTVSAYKNCLKQVNNQILSPETAIVSLSEILPVINANRFDDYKRRSDQIQRYKDLLAEVMTPSNEISQGRFLIKWKIPRGFKYGIIYNDEVSEVPEALLTSQDIATAITVKYPKLVRKALKDYQKGFENKYKSAYLEEVKKYHKI